MIALGVGFSSRCTVAELRELVAEVIAAAGAPSHRGLLAVPERKRGSGIVEPVAAQCGLALDYIPEERLRAWQDEAPTVSHRAQATIGLHSVAEAAALAAAGDGARLIVARRTRRLASCAAACASPHEQEEA